MAIDQNRVKKEFNAYYQTTIDNLKVGHPQIAGMTAGAIINVQHDFLWGRLPKTQNVYEFEKLTDYQKSVYYKALIQQIYYVLTEGDFSGMSGYDVTTNSFLPKGELDKRALAPAAKRTLIDGGLFYPALNGSASVGRRRWI
ncbi:MAG: hypothetical protein IJ308_04395 [Clostridia bacterium]|nr:hypothetical protein [Clostridia bacterium]